MKKITATNYKKDKLYPAVARAVAEILKRGAVVAPVDVLLQMERITKQQLVREGHGQPGVGRQPP